MQNLHVIAALNSNARYVHLFQVEGTDIPIYSKEIIGEPLGEFATDDTNSRLLRATYAECLFTADPQKCVVVAKSGTRYQFRFEKVIHDSKQLLLTEDEIVVISLITRLPEQVKLTKREEQIVKLICHDMSNVEIARELKVKTSTIETHRQNIRQKLGVKGNAGVVMYAVQHGLAD